MMSRVAHRLPRIVSPIVPVVVVDGRQVALVTVEDWPSRVRLRLAIIQDESTDALDEQFRGLRRTAHDQRFEDLPDMPAQAIFNEIEWVLKDKAATQYQMESGSVAGSGSEWEADWLFRPGIPAEITEIEIVARTATGDHSVLVDLPAQS